MVIRQWYRCPIFVVMMLSLTACGDAKPDDQKYNVPKVETFFWEPGNILPSWFVADGQYQSDCLEFGPSLNLNVPRMYQQIVYTTKDDLLGAEIRIYEPGSCSRIKQVRAFEARLSLAYLGIDEHSRQQYVSYSADKYPAAIKESYYLDKAAAELLNTYGICGQHWHADSLNSTLGLDKGKCEADADKIAEKDLSLDKFMVGIQLMNMFNFRDLSLSIYMTVREEAGGLRVKGGPGLEFEKEDRFFKAIPH